MISLAQLLRQYQPALISANKKHIQKRHYAAMQAIIDCHTPARGELQYHCFNCHQQQYFCCSCGNRSCPACQHGANNQWLNRQRSKLLPVDYYMITFTLPQQLRGFVWYHQEWACNALFKTAVETLRQFFKNDKRLGVEPGLTGVIHTHSRRLDFHPHVHLIVPDGGLNRKSKTWKRKHGKYLFNGKALGKVFRGKFIEAMLHAGFYTPKQTPATWVAHCEKAGQGEPALVYLARYLYRGVISEDNILRHQDGNVTYQYRDSQTSRWKTRTLTAVDFLWTVLKHVLPRGFRRTRDYGFLHGSAKKTLYQLQLKLRPKLRPATIRRVKAIKCNCCGFAMQFIRRIPNLHLVGAVTMS